MVWSKLISLSPALRGICTPAFLDNYVLVTIGVDTIMADGISSIANRSLFLHGSQFAS